MDNLKVETMKVEAFIVKFEGEYTIFTNEIGGAIITGSDLEETKKNFERATAYNFSIKNMIFFSKELKSAVEKVKNNEKSISFSNSNIGFNYHSQLAS